jgi:hypothetical protein
MGLKSVYFLADEFFIRFFISTDFVCLVIKKPKKKSDENSSDSIYFQF